MDKIHRIASAGFTQSAETYARGRPEYPAALDGWLRHDLGIKHGTSVLDLGAGTGKFTRKLLATEAQVFAVEPVSAMAEQLRKQQLKVDLRAGSAESISLPDATLDGVFCAQAFHWFSTAAAVKEIYRVLKPGGRLGLIWNVRDVRVPWVAAVTAILRAYEGGTPRYDTDQWRQVFPASGFTALQKQEFPHMHVGHPEQVIVDRVLSVSFIGAREPVARQQVAAQLRDLIANTPELAGRDSVGFPYTTVAFSCSKLSA